MSLLESEGLFDFFLTKDGVVFYKSSNNVILTEGLNGCLKPIYFAKVEDKEGRSLLSMKE